MLCTWLHRAGNAQAIVFFNGWGMDGRVVAHMQPAGYDVLEVHDYRHAGALPTALASYEKKHVVAWSTGVMFSACYPEGWASAVALNGTGRTVDNAYGIPERAFAITIRRFSAAVCAAFMAKAAMPVPCRAHAALGMAEGLPVLPTPLAAAFSANCCDESSLEALRDELCAIQAFVPPLSLMFTRAFVSEADEIMPAAHQRAWWARQGLAPRPLGGGHYPFAAFTSWAELINA
ncbi:MAG: DUF452 family protein [Desulfovibrionaceae bacterium]|nr:DUF452 family protein [Desulfovibrionaceae bacterium]